MGRRQGGPDRKKTSSSRDEESTSESGSGSDDKNGNNNDEGVMSHHRRRSTERPSVSNNKDKKRKHVSLEADPEGRRRGRSSNRSARFSSSSSAEAAAAIQLNHQKPSRSSNRAVRFSSSASAAAAAAIQLNQQKQQKPDGILGALIDMLKKTAGRNGDMDNIHDLDGSDDNDEIEIDIEKAQNVLEAAAGNLALASQLFWDDYHATEQNNINKHRGSKSGQEDSNYRRSRLQNDKDRLDGKSSPSYDYEEEYEWDYEYDVDISKKGRSYDDQADDDEEGDDDGGDGGASRSSHVNRPPRNISRARALDFAKPVRRTHRNRDARNGSRSNQDNNRNDGSLEANPVGNSDVISDEEAVGRRPRGAKLHRISGKKRTKNAAAAAAERHKQIKEVAESITREVFSRRGMKNADDDDTKTKRRRYRRTETEEDDDDNDDPDDYISDDDWLGEEAGPSIKDVLWSNRISKSEPLPDVSQSSDVSQQIDVDEESFEGIPKTWLSVAFQLSDCTTGLTANPPDLDSIEEMARGLNRDAERRTQWPPPYHCKSVTAILSVVTALLYTGSSIQGEEVSCRTGRKPWADLSPEDRRREFDARLADALSSLIFIAAKTSLRRKKKSYHLVRKANKEKGKDLKDDDVAHEHHIQRRLHLIPVCSWNEQSDIPTAPRGPGDTLYERRNIKTSLTNIKAIKPYVSSTMRSFTAPGGVALLIETILRIHGSGFVARNLAMTRTKHQKGNRDVAAAASELYRDESCVGLIRCTCDERQKILNGNKPMPANVRNDPIKLMDLTPPGNECVSLELLTLLLTGRMQPTFADCAPTGLGFGLLTDNIGEVSPFLSRPEKPVWVLRGETCFSVLCMKDVAGNDDVDFKTISKMDSPGVTLDMMHWNCWYTGRKKSELRVITASESWVPPSTLSKLSVWDRENEWRPLVTTNARRAKLINRISVEEARVSVAKEKNEEITRKELARVRFHPEDKLLYPGQYKMWRYDLGQGEDENNRDAAAVVGKEGSKPRESNWCHFFRLSARQKRVVELKMGPKINAILLTRWPGARIGDFVPKDEEWPTV